MILLARGGPRFFSSGRFLLSPPPRTHPSIPPTINLPFTYQAQRLKVLSLPVLIETRHLLLLQLLFVQVVAFTTMLSTQPPPCTRKLSLPLPSLPFTFYSNFSAFFLRYLAALILALFPGKQQLFKN